MRKKSTYEELYALQILHHLLGYDLKKWEAMDQPDLQNQTDSWGIEVVRDLYPKEEESRRHIESVWTMRYSEWPLKKRKILEQNKVKLNIQDDIIKFASLGETSNTPEHLIQTIKEKIDQLNKKQYHYFNRYDLYVLVDTTVIDIDYISYVTQIIEIVTDYQKNAELKYNTLYLAHDHVICVCDLEKKTFKHIAISLKLRGRIAEYVNEKLLQISE